MKDKMFNDILDSIINNATAEEIEIIREKLNNHLINHIYESDVHEELNNDFDSSSCPHCSSHQIIKYGRDNKGNQRFYCKECRKTFSVITGSLFAYTKKEAYQWYLYIESLLRGDTIKQSANIACICEYTSFVWRHKILSIIANITDDKPVLSDTVYLDEKLIDIVTPGTLAAEPKVKKRGVSEQKRNIACAVDEHGKQIVVVSQQGRITSAELCRIFKECIPDSCTVVSDSQRSYHKLMKELGVTWVKIPSKKTEKDGYTLEKVNLLHSSIELFMHKYRGISDKYMRNYIGMFKLKENYPQYYSKNIINMLFRKIANSLCDLKYKDMKGEFLFSMIN